jgi:hypothetical protein
VGLSRDRTFRYRVRIDRPIAPRADAKESFVEATVTEFAWEVHAIAQLLRQTS